MSGNLGTVPLATHSILAITAGIWYVFPNGFAQATATLIGQSLGAGIEEDAVKYSKLGYAIDLFYASFWGAISLSYKDKWGYLFTNDIDVITLTAQMIPILWAYNVFDTLKCIGIGEIRGIGRPLITVGGNFISTIIVGYPVGLLLAFKFHMGLQGVWIGMTLAWAVAGTIYLIYILRISWKHEIAVAAERNEKGINQ